MKLMIEALQAAQRVLADHLKPKPKAFDTTSPGYWHARATAADSVINNLLGILDNKALVEEQRAMEAGAVPAVMDPNVSKVRKLLLDRSAVGIKKYGVTTAGAKLDLSQWLQHLQEELCDAAVYVEAIKSGMNPVKELEEEVRNLKEQLFQSETRRTETERQRNRLRDKLIDAQHYIRNINAE